MRAGVLRLAAQGPQWDMLRPWVHNRGWAALSSSALTFTTPPLSIMSARPAARASRLVLASLTPTPPQHPVPAHDFQWFPGSSFDLARRRLLRRRHFAHDFLRFPGLVLQSLPQRQHLAHGFLRLTAPCLSLTSVTPPLYLAHDFLWFPRLVLPSCLPQRQHPAHGFLPFSAPSLSLTSLTPPRVEHATMTTKCCQHVLQYKQATITTTCRVSRFLGISQPQLRSTRR